MATKNNEANENQQFVEEIDYKEIENIQVYILSMFILIVATI